MTFFSWIPLDIHRIIASKLLHDIESRYENGIDFIKSEENLKALLAYSWISSDSLQAVLCGLNHSLVPWHWSNDLLTKSIIRFAEELREINLSHTHSFRFFKDVPTLPKLRKAVIKANLHHTEFIKHGKNLKELKILFEANYDWQWIISAVQELNLKSLELNFLTDRYQTLQDLSMEELESLSSACQTVENLTLKGHVQLTPEVEHMIFQFPCLKKLCIEGEILEFSIPFLHRIPELEFFNLSTASLITISSLRNRVKGIKGLVANVGDMNLLKSFPSLKHLDIQPVDNLSEILKSAMWRVEALTIHLDYELEPLGNLPGCNGSYVVRRYRKLNVPVLIKILQEANSLTSLCLKNMILSSEDIDTILHTVGKSLKQFHICIDWQHEITWIRIFNILNSVSKYCPNLEDLRFLEDDTDNTSPIIASGMQKMSCEKALTKISRNSQNFMSFNRNMRFIQQRFVVGQDQPAGSEQITWDDLIPLLFA